MKIIKLLNKIANGEKVPKKIKFYGKYYIWYDNEYTGNTGYCLEPLKADSNSFLEIDTVYDLNKEVEIIEEDKKIEKLEQRIDTGLIGSESTSIIEHANRINRQANYLSDIVSKVNELIDKVNNMENNK